MDNITPEMGPYIKIHTRAVQRSWSEGIVPADWEYNITNSK